MHTIEVTGYLAVTSILFGGYLHVTKCYMWLCVTYVLHVVLHVTYGLHACYLYVTYMLLAEMFDCNQL